MSTSDRMTEPEFTSCRYLYPITDPEDDFMPLYWVCVFSRTYSEECWEKNNCPIYKPVTMEFLVKTLEGIG